MTYQELGGQGMTPASIVGIGSVCENCGSKMGEICINPLTGKPRAASCKGRGKTPTGELSAKAESP